MNAVPAPLRAVAVAVDFSEGLRIAVDRALRLPLGWNSTVTLLHIVPATIAFNELPDKEIARATTVTQGRGLKISSAVLAGDAPPTVVDHPAALGASRAPMPLRRNWSRCGQRVDSR